MAGGELMENQLRLLFLFYLSGGNKYWLYFSHLTWSNYPTAAYHSLALQFLIIRQELLLPLNLKVLLSQNTINSIHTNIIREVLIAKYNFTFYGKRSSSVQMITTTTRRRLNRGQAIIIIHSKNITSLSIEILFSLLFYAERIGIGFD